MPLFVWIAAGGLGLLLLLSRARAAPAGLPPSTSTMWEGLDRETQNGLLSQQRELLARAAEPDAANDPYLLGRLRQLASVFEGYNRRDLAAPLRSQAQRLFPGVSTGFAVG